MKPIGFSNGECLIVGGGPRDGGGVLSSNPVHTAEMSDLA